MNDEKEPQSSNPWVKSLAIWVGILLALVLFVSVFDSSARDRDSSSIAYSDFLRRVDDGGVKSVEIAGDVITGKLTGDQSFRTYAPKDDGLIDRLAAKN